MDLEIVGCVSGKKYRLEAMTFGERNKILDETTVISETGEIHIKAGTVRMLNILFSVKEPKLKMEDIAELDPKEAEQLSKAVAEVNKRPLES